MKISAAYAFHLNNQVEAGLACVGKCEPSLPLPELCMDTGHGKHVPRFVLSVTNIVLLCT